MRNCSKYRRRFLIWCLQIYLPIATIICNYDCASEDKNCMPAQLERKIVRKAESLHFLHHKMFVKTKNQERNTHTSAHTIMTKDTWFFQTQDIKMFIYLLNMYPTFPHFAQSCLHRILCSNSSDLKDQFYSVGWAERMWHVQTHHSVSMAETKLEFGSSQSQSNISPLYHTGSQHLSTQKLQEYLNSIKRLTVGKTAHFFKTISTPWHASSLLGKTVILEFSNIVTESNSTPTLYRKVQNIIQF